MKCPVCLKQPDRGKCSAGDHTFYYWDDGTYSIDLLNDKLCIYVSTTYNKTTRIEKTHDNDNRSSIIAIIKEYTPLKNAMEILNRYIKLRAFL